MNYVISDLHGRYDLFLRMLEKIRLTATDTLYLLGDAADRGPDGIPLLLDVMARKNVVMLLGNHEDMFRRVIRYRESKLSILKRSEAQCVFHNWTVQNGGGATWRAYLKLPAEQQAAIRDFLLELRLYQDLTVNNRRFLLTHAGVGDYQWQKRPEDCGLRELIWTRMDYSKTYYADRYLVTGHTPTALIDPACRGKIYRRNNHVAIDCGAVFFGTLGCFCLDTMEEIYVC